LDVDRPQRARRASPEHRRTVHWSILSAFQADVRAAQAAESIGGPVQFSTSTIERWYYTARRSKHDPVRVLRRIIRKDAGQISLPAVQVEQLLTQYRDHEHWSYQLHYDNLVAWVQARPTRGPLRSYSTVRWYMQAHGWLRKRRAAAKGRPGEQVAAQRRERREIRSYETEYVGSLWHLDFHHGSLPVLLPSGQWQRPLALGIVHEQIGRGIASNCS